MKEPVTICVVVGNGKKAVRFRYSLPVKKARKIVGDFLFDLASNAVWKPKRKRKANPR